MTPDVHTLQPKDARTLCRFCLRAERFSKMRLLGGNDKSWPDSELGKLYAQLTGEKLLAHEEPLISDSWCVECALRMREAVESATKFRESNAFWAAYLAVWRTDEAAIKMEIVEVPMQMAHTDSHPANPPEDPIAVQIDNMERHTEMPMMLHSVGAKELVPYVDKHTNTEPRLEASNTAGSQLECDICGRTFDDKVQLRRHFCDDHAFERYKCDECKLTNLTQSVWQSHQDMHRASRKRVQAELQALREEMNTKFDRLLAGVRALAQNVTAVQSSIVPNPAVQLPSMPFSTVDELTKFNAKLEDNEFQEQMVLHLKDKDKPASVSVRTKICLESLMRYELTVQYSWSGLSGIYCRNLHPKQRFCDLHGVRRLVLDVLQYQSGTVIETSSVDAAFKDFLRRAAQRAPKK